MIGKNIDRAAELLIAGELVGIPTETVYGLAANGENSEAILKIYETKNRPTFNPLILHVASFDEIEKYAFITDERIITLVKKFSPGPITFLLPKKPKVNDLITSGLGTVAIRIPNHQHTLDLLKALPFALAAPSANNFGYISPTSAEHVFHQMSGKIPYILDGGSCEIGLESTIISFINKVPEILRFGGVSVEEIEAVIGKIKINHVEEEFKPSAPGMLKSHYAPKIPLYYGHLEELIANFTSTNAALITLKDVPSFKGRKYILSENGDLHEAASKLFSVMRLIDSEQQVEKIYALPFPSNGLGFAINDRLKR
ncbi:MAG: threonylcarbamoyl-AMP synthase, partial [Bacteroidetes bacterium]|nr:threonylcarbamoyl-AMP synthase [Bacteroidota bacterium]